MIDLENIIKFTEMLHRFQQVKRAVIVNGEERQENDAEHSFQLAITAWYVVSANNLDFDKEKVLMYALAHDLVEVYAGDIPFNEPRDQKEANERKAMIKLREKFPEFEDLHEYIERYEGRADKEAKFVYALDKVVPLLNIYLDDGRSWEANEVTFEILLKHKGNKVEISPEVKPYFEEMLQLIEDNQDKLF